MSVKMVLAYLDQAEQYLSDSKGTFLLISEMAPAHAANAAARYISDARTWAIEAGRMDMAQAQAWMVRKPLFLALVLRANQN